MAGLEADTSSYAQPLPVSPLKQAGEIGALQQQSQQIQSGAISIDKQKLDLMNTQFGLMNQELSGMIDDPSITKQQAAQRLGRFATTLKLPPEAVNHMMEELQQAPSVKAFSENALRRGMDTQQKINQQYGTPENQSSGAVNYQGVRDPRTGAFKPATQMPVQPPVGSPYYEGGQAKTLGPSGPEGVQPVARSLPVAPPQGVGSTVPIAPKPIRSLPVERPVSGPTGETIRRTDMEAGAPAGARKASGFNAAPPPMFEEGRKMLAEDQGTATAKATALKPLEEAYDIAKAVKTGPGTENWNKARAHLMNAGVISADEKDPTAIYQMMNKNLAQFIDKNGSRSDADLAVKESGNANAKTQVQPALLHMIQKIIARERIEIARPSAFGGDKLEEYGSHKSNFPTSQDERAYAIDKMPPDEARSLYKDMRTKALNGNLDAIKFIKSLATAKKAGVIGGINQ